MNTKQKLSEEISREIENKEKELEESDKEIIDLKIRMKIDNKALEMKDMKEELREDFKYSVQALENILVMEENKNSESKQGLEILKYRKAVLESQFTDNELDRE